MYEIMNPRLFAPKSSSDSGVSAKPTAAQSFYAGLPKNTLLALLTVPPEGLALRRIFYTLDNPSIKPPAYMEVLKNIGLKGLFAGVISRTSYCLTGNFATLLGIDYFGKDVQGIIKTTVAKNCILPLFLASNARQTNRDFYETLIFMAKGVKDPVVHLSFFFRNLVANSCLLPGFMVRDYSYKAMNESNTQTPTLLGFATSVTASTLMNAFLKPFFTGHYELKTRWGAAFSMPAKFPLLMREFASLALIFGNTPLEKEQVCEEKEIDQETSSSKFRP